MSDEKVAAPEHKEILPSSGVDSLESNIGGQFDAPRTARLLRKMDWNIVPFLALLYLLSFLDRTNIGNARLAGLEADLGMNKASLQYNTALAIFFPFYVAAEIPSNMMLKRTRPSLWFAFIMVAWGLCMTFMGFVHSYAGLLVARAFLGIAEGGLFPGVTFYITMWYRRHECGLRMAIFFSAATAAGAFGGLLARGISEMNGLGGKAGWAWIFILEGILTLIIAAVAFFVINDYPETARFLTEEERVEVVRRLREDRSALADEFGIQYFWDALKDWKIWVHMFITIGIYTPLYSFSLFLPTIIRNMGYTNERSQLMTVPPYVVACLFTIAGGKLADSHRKRGPFMIFFCLLAIGGFTMLIASQKPSVQYAGTFLAACGVYPNVPMGVAWNGNNIGGSTKRGVGLAMHVGFGNLGGMIGAFIYRSRDAPHYYHGHGTLIATLSMSAMLSLFMSTWLRRENARRDRVAQEKGHPLNADEYTPEMLAKEREDGDYASFFRYTI
ncbi:putative transporter C1002,16c [Schizosaccharomyces pombe 972h-] [Rhizoctonia solani]|uniref:Putative transporter C1002,16c [Schizosaccharomyces pombe 972h-] n=1 Tax=Rhizoctonia solani TaxID=456999 RepID=A0A0K6GD23_9AGAM|nr:putative transporter C1002,16c [Schizosaccharomyces pombe 972h-] [Rhizoctonia solani]